MSLRNWIKLNISKENVYILSLFLLAIVITISILISFLPNKTQNAVRKVTNRPDYMVRNLTKERDGWALAEIVSTRGVDRGNNSFVVIHSNDGDVSIMLGPGTHFNKYAMTSANIPKEVQEDIDNYFKKRKR
ncbi:hypothetical protein GX865_04140 [Candidatus Saccharibacteria bacterium]|jgi:hypothetical protein|nr:hypothetical protein [Candidatus Saccharibacteria bacterium]